MKVLGVLPESIGGRLTTSSLIDGFKLLGYQVLIYDVLKDTFQIDNEYDLIVGYDFSALKIKKDNCLRVKSVNYFSDEIRSRTSGPFWEELLPMLNTDDNYTFYWDRELVKKEQFKNIFYLPHFVNTKIYYDKRLLPEMDVMFAGRLDTDYRLNMIVELVETMPNVKFRWYAIKKHYEDALSRVKNKDTIKKIYSGFIDNEVDMSDAINKSKIVINMNSQGVSSLNYRTIQTLACGKLLLSDDRLELDLFDNLIPVYKDIDSLKQLINYYLNSRQEYDLITKKCSKICRERHNSITGVQYILNKIQ